MKKLFTLLTLLVAIVTGAWGETVTVGRTATFSADTHANTLLPADNSDLTVTIADGTQDMGAKDANKSTKDIYYKSSTTSVKIDAFLCYRTKINNAGLGSFNENAYAGFKVEIAEGKYLELSQINGKVATADDGTVCRIIVEDANGTALQTSSDKTVDRNSGNDFTVTSSLKLTGTVYVKMHYWTTKKSGNDPHTSKYMVPVELSITGNLESSTAPIISTNPKSINLQATESGEVVNSSFTITGSNLTDGIYDLAIPSVAGLSVSPTSFTVSNGSVNQTVNVSYSSTKNVPSNTASITASVDDINLRVDVNYSASVVSWTLQPISTAKEWDFGTKVTSSSDGELKYTGDDATTEHVYANIPELTFTDPFDATALAFTGTNPFRSNSKKFCQDGTLHFKTSVPGTIKVKFSDTGSSASATAVKRYLVVNDENTEYWTSREKTGDDSYAAQLNVTTGEISVPAGDVTIKGSSAIVVSYLSFTPAAASVSVGAKGFATYCNADYALDFTGKSIEAYTVSSNGASLTLTKKQKVAKGEPVLLYSATNSDTQMIPIITENEATADNTNKLVAGNGSPITWTDDNPVYILYTGGATPGFYRANNSTVAANKAYLNLGAAGARAVSFSLNFDDVTAISEVATEEDDKSAPVYDLQGRRVAQPAKGLYIVNGKKVIIK